MLMDNKKLVLILAVLTGLFLLVRWMKGEKNVRNFDTTLFVLDTSKVNTLKL